MAQVLQFLGHILPSFDLYCKMFAAPLMRSALRNRVPGLARRSILQTQPFRAFSNVKFAPTHEWIKVDGEVGVVGISDFAQGALGEVVYCDLPTEGATVSAKETIATLESVKAVGEVYAPADCEVLEVNEKLNDEPALVNTSAEEDGWLVKVKPTGDTSSLMDRDAYDKHVEAEAAEE